MFRSVNILRREVLIKSRGLSAQAAVSFKPKHNELQEAKSFKEIPGLSRFELIKRFMLNGQYQNLSMFDIQNRMREEFGDFYRMQGLFGNPDSLTTFNAEDVEFVHRNEGSYPHRRGLQTLKYYREKIRPDIFNVGGLIVE